MNLELHHFFIQVKPGGEVAELLSSIGMQEGTRNQHAGQGTANRRFHFSNGALELLWVHDEDEAMNGPGRDMCLAERARDDTASPFGLIFNRRDDGTFDMPFAGWTYQPVYFQPPWAFHVGANSKNIIEPLCVYMPFIEPGMAKGLDENELFKTVSQVTICTPCEPLSNVLNAVNHADRLLVKSSHQHLMELSFNDHRAGLSHDFRPDIPLVVYW